MKKFIAPELKAMAFMVADIVTASEVGPEGNISRDPGDVSYGDQAPARQATGGAAAVRENL